MPALEKTRALMAELAAACGLDALEPDDTGAYQLTVGGIDIFIYGGDDIMLLIVVPIGPLPEHPTYALVNYLLRSNMFGSDIAPFVVATDEAGTLVQWGRLRIENFDGPSLATAIDNLAGRAETIGAELGA